MKNLKTKFKRVVSAFLCTSLLFCSIIGANAKSIDGQEKKDISSQSISLLSGKTIDMINPYVSMDNDRYVLNLPSEVSKKLTSDELILVSESIKKANSFIELNKEKVKINEDKNECSVTIPDSSLKTKSTNNSILASRGPLTTGGETKVVSHWWGISLFLSSDMVKSIAIGEVAGLAALIALIPGAGWAVAGAIAGAIGGYWVSEYNYMPCVVQLSWAVVSSVRFAETFFVLPQDSSLDYDYFLGAPRS